jgi:hypothetical protein
METKETHTQKTEDRRQNKATCVIEAIIIQ